MKRAVLIAALLLIPPALSPALADKGRGGTRDHDDARAAMERGDIRPLSDLASEVETRLGARLIEAELEGEGGRYVYSFKLITADGRILEVEVDAASGAVLSSEKEDD